MAFSVFSLLRLLLPGIILALAFPAAAAQRVGHVEVELIAERDGLQTGGDNTIALRLVPDPGWHVYWRNPGDSGLPTTIDWTLPAGIQAGDIQWPYPHPHQTGTLTNYGFDAEVLHLVPLTVDNGLAGRTVKLAADAAWLVCAEICIPGNAKLTLDISVGATAGEPNTTYAAAFIKARAALPQPLATDAQFSVDEKQFTLALTNHYVRESKHVAFFPYANELVAHAATQDVRFDGARMTLTQTRSPYFITMPQKVDGVLVVQDHSGEHAYEISAALSPIAARSTPTDNTTSNQVATTASLPLILLLALAGGLILNLMPCVFPVLSIKAMALMQAGSHTQREQRRHALAYTAGVLTSFLLVAGLLLALRAGGAALGWGFQLQSPVFVALLVYLLFALGLSLSGIVEFSGRWMGTGQQFASQSGLAGAFFTGVLAVVVASPCTAPFMGAALGYALVQPPLLSLSVFFALGLGLALPFLILGFVPQLARHLPRPGPWMQTFRQWMAFPMYLTVVWLLWVLMRQSGPDAAALALIGMVVLAFALWQLTKKTSRARHALSILALLLAFGLLAHPLLRNGLPTAQAATVGWEPYSDGRLAALQAAGKSVFVNFTADWCITCKVNEGSTLSNDAVKAAFAERDITLLRADWTRADPAITAALARYGRSGVPLYLLARPGEQPIVLPQILTPDLLIDSLKTPH